MDLSNAAEDYSKYFDVNLQEKLDPINTCIEDMFSRLEEFETMMCFVMQDGRDSVEIISSVLEHKAEFEELCRKIDAVESLTSHIKDNLDKLEADIAKAEADLGCSEPALKVTNMLTLSPLFKKSQDRKSPNPQHLEMFHVDDYFQTSEKSEDS